jgi:hypothetical protein
MSSADQLNELLEKLAKTPNDINLIRQIQALIKLTSQKNL